MKTITGWILVGSRGAPYVNGALTKLRAYHKVFVRKKDATKSVEFYSARGKRFTIQKVCVVDESVLEAVAVLKKNDLSSHICCVNLFGTVFYCRECDRTKTCAYPEAENYRALVMLEQLAPRRRK